jgi:hypothetical protein
MRLDELLQLKEMPGLVKKELDDDEGEHEEFNVYFMSNSALENRKYKLIARQDDTEVYLEDGNDTAIIGTRGVRHDGEDGIHVVGQLLFKLSLKLGSKERQEFGPNVLQVDLVNVAKKIKMQGLGTFLYHSLVAKGYTIISDNKQYEGGQALWKKIARSHASNEMVLLLDHGQLVMKDGKPIEYDGTNVPDDEIWSETDQLKKFMLLVYTRKH